MRADVSANGIGLLHVFNVHLGTAFLERRHQARKLINTAILNNQQLAGAADVDQLHPGKAGECVGRVQAVEGGGERPGVEVEESSDAGESHVADGQRAE